MIMKKQLLAIAVGAALSASALAQERAASAAAPGFYGGVALRDRTTEATGVGIAAPSSAWNKYSTLLTESEGSRQLAFGGYRWRNDLALEASVARIESYALRPAGTGAGVGLSFGPADVLSRTLNLDLYGSWEMRRSLSLYGRLGYAQSEVAPVYGTSLAFMPDARRTRDGVNYGIGLRYDLTPGFGLRLEYARFGHVPGEVSTGLMPESDRLQFGVQFRF